VADDCSEKSPIATFSSKPPAVDRLALYLIPLQLFVFARLPLALGPTFGYGAIIWAVILYYALVLYVWLNFATHAFAWLPYQFYPLTHL
jgi:hypothetical protein